MIKSLRFDYKFFGDRIKTLLHNLRNITQYTSEVPLGDARHTPSKI